MQRKIFSVLQSCCLPFLVKKTRTLRIFYITAPLSLNASIKAEHNLVCDNNALLTEGKFVILGYFSVSLRVLELFGDLSNRKRKILDGLSAKLHGKVIGSIPCYLVGQLVKNSDIPDEQSVSGAELINRAISIIRSAETLVGGRYVLIECRDNSELLKFYADNRFELFEKLPFGDVPMVQMLRML